MKRHSRLNLPNRMPIFVAVLAWTMAVRSAHAVLIPTPSTESTVSSARATTLPSAASVSPSTAATAIVPPFVSPVPAPHSLRDPPVEIPSFETMLKRMVLYLFLIVAALVVAAKLLPKWMGRSPLLRRGKMIEVIEAHRLEPGKTIYLLRITGQYFLIGSSSGRLDILSGGPLDGEKIASILNPTDTKSTSSLAVSNKAFSEVLKGKPEIEPNVQTPQRD